MSKNAVFTLKLEPDLRDAFLAEAAAKHLPASHLVREFMRDFVQRERGTREYDEWFRRKIDVAEADVEAGRTFSNEEVEAEAAEWRAELLRQVNESAA